MVEDVKEVFQMRRGGALTVEGSNLFTKVSELEGQLSTEQARLNYLYYLQDYIVSNNDFSTVASPSGLGIQDPVLAGYITRLIELYSNRNKMNLPNGIRF
jgi:hypothetical protein